VVSLFGCQGAITSQRKASGHGNTKHKDCTRTTTTTTTTDSGNSRRRHASTQQSTEETAPCKPAHGKHSYAHSHTRTSTDQRTFAVRARDEFRAWSVIYYTDVKGSRYERFLRTHDQERISMKPVLLSLFLCTVVVANALPLVNHLSDGAECVASSQCFWRICRDHVCCGADFNCANCNKNGVCTKCQPGFYLGVRGVCISSRAGTGTHPPGVACGRKVPSKRKACRRRRRVVGSKCCWECKNACRGGYVCEKVDENTGVCSPRKL
jgi:hypothetical protein